MAITGVRSITHLYRGAEGWTASLYLISYELIFLNLLTPTTTQPTHSRIILVKNGKNLRGRYTYAAGRRCPIGVLL